MHAPGLIRLALAVAVFTGSGGSGWSVQSGEMAWLSGADILRRFRNATLEGRYASGKAFVERYDANGRLSYAEEGLTIGGHWSVTAGTLCTIYDEDTTGGCYRVARVDQNCYEFYFVSRTEETAPGPTGGRPRWTARGALRGQPSACRDDPSV
jgi:hypothetical protein